MMIALFKYIINNMDDKIIQLQNELLQAKKEIEMLKEQQKQMSKQQQKESITLSQNIVQNSIEEFREPEKSNKTEFTMTEDQMKFWKSRWDYY